MPEPFNDFACDKPIYNILKSLAPSLCFMNPTHITLLNGLLSGVIVHRILQKQDFIGLFILRVVLDMLDGTIARECNKMTEFGGYLDMIIDDVFYPAALIAILSTYDKLDLFHITLVGILFVLYKKSKFVYEIMHDNSILLPFAYSFLIKYMESGIVLNETFDGQLGSHGFGDEVDSKHLPECTETQVGL